MTNQFFIRQSATQPILLMKLTKDGGTDYQKFHNALENSSITFSMVDITTGIYKIANKSGGIIQKEKLVNDDEPNEYYIYYKFTSGDTKNVGTYRGEFKINLYDVSGSTTTGTFIGPINSDLIINVIDSITKVDINY